MLMPFVQSAPVSAGAWEAICGLQLGELALGARRGDGMKTEEISKIK